jgi:hypothetical protein
VLSHVKGEERVYGTARVYVKTESKQAMEGELEWGEVYLQQGEAIPCLTLFAPKASRSRGKGR